MTLMILGLMDGLLKSVDSLPSACSPLLLLKAVSFDHV